MRIKESFEIKSMCLGDYEIPIPEGFSDLMNRSGAWSLIDPDKKENPSVEEYSRKVVKEEGRLRSYLTYKCSSLEKAVSNRKTKKGA